MKKIFSFLFAICCVITVFISCQKDFSVENGSTLFATGSLWDSAGNCLPDTVIGTFYNGVTPGSDTAYVEIQVNVTQTGSYNITTTPPIENGFEFADSGFFSNTGINIIRLKPIGTPILNTPTTFTISFDSSICSFTVNVQDSTGTGLGGQQDTTGHGGDPDGGSGNWQFTSDGFLYSGKSLTAYEKDTSGGHLLVIGTPDSNSDMDTAIAFIISIPSATITTGTYTSTSVTNPFIYYVNDNTNGVFLFQADLTTTSVSMTVIITSYDASTKLLKGTFSGTAVDESGTTMHTITNGSFSVTVQ